MEIQVIGRIFSILLIFFSGMVLMLGINFFRREKNAGNIRVHLLIHSLAAFLWGFCYGIMGFNPNLELNYLIRRIGVMGIDIFLFVDFCVVVDISHINEKLSDLLKRLVAFVLVIDWFLFSGRKVNTFYNVDGYVTWQGNACFGRSFHMVFFILLAILMGTLGVLAYRKYRYKRQKGFMVCFYIGNLCLLSGTLLDTIIVLDYALPCSAFGALVSSLILWLGTMRFSAFDVSVANVYDKIYDLINVGIFVFDDAYQLVYVNPAGIRMIDITRYAGKHIFEVFDVSRERERLYFEDALSEYSGGFYIRARETGLQCNGRINTVADGFKEPYCYIMTLYDITKETNMLEELRVANETKEHFLTSMSHEIRTPINSLIGMNEMILRECQDEKILSYATNIESSGGLLLSIVNDILDFSKIESGKLEVFQASYDMSSLINDLYHVIAKKASDKELQLEITANPKMPSWLMGDEVRIKQIVLNILVNAVKYTDEGCIFWDCDYSVIDEENINLVFSIRDTGRGMKKVDTDALFKSFTRLDEKKNQTIEGTGLGLSITKALLDLMGGTISIESLYGVGSRFTIIIPQKISNNAPMGSIAERMDTYRKQEKNHKSELAATDHSDITILAVDDVEMNLMVLEAFLKDTGIKVVKATSGREALRKCKNSRFDMIFMDHMMPEMDGVECMNRIKAECEQNRNTPIVVLTANAIVGVRDKYIAAGFVDYLSKPLDAKKLDEVIRTHLKL